MTKIYDDVPVSLLKWYYQVWDTDGVFGEDIHCEFMSIDSWGECPITNKLRELLTPFITDETQLKRVVKAIENWIYNESLTIETDEDMQDFIEDEL